MVFIESNESYLKMLPALNQARFGAYIIFPFQFQDDEFHLEWTDKTFCACDVDTIDLNETIRAMMSRSGPLMMSIIKSEFLRSIRESSRRKNRRC